MTKFAFGLMLIIFTVTPALADYYDSPELPEKPVAKLIKPLVEIINSKNEEKAQAFIKANFNPKFLADFPMSMHLEFLQSIAVEKDEFSFHSVRSYDEPQPANELVVILRNNRSESWHAIVINYSADNPEKIVGLDFTGARTPSDIPQETKLSLKQAISELDEYVKRMADKDVFSGSVLLAKGNDILYQSAHGLASKRFDVPNNINTKFNLGSMNKMFTSVAIMQLVSANKLSLDSKLSEYLDESWLPKSISEKIEIRHLLTHSSGLGSYFNQRYSESSKNNFRALDDYKPLVINETLRFEPGTSNSYSNTGMLLLGVVIEKVSSQDYFSYIQEHIYQPARMHNSDSYEMDQPIPNLAIGYDRNNNETGWINNLYSHVLKGGPAGGGFSTVGDLHKFAKALTGYKLLDKEHTQQLYSAKPELHSPNYGFGFGVFDVENDQIVGHSGGFRGISSNLDIYLKQGYVAVVMSNYGEGAPPIEAKIRSLLARVK